MWYRVGDIYKVPKPAYFYCFRKKRNITCYPHVRLCTRIPAVLIRSISITHQPGWHLSVSLYANKFFKYELDKITNFPHFYISTEEDLASFISVLDKINQQRRKEEISCEVIDEIKHIFYALQLPSTVSGHALEHKISTQLLDKSASLISIRSFKYLGSSRYFLPPKEREKSKKERKDDVLRTLKYLSAGASPNTVVHYGRLPLLAAAEQDNLELFKLLLFYYADPFLPGDDDSYMSPAEYVHYYKQNDLLNLIIIHLSNPEKPLKTLKLKQIQLEGENNKIHTLFHFTNDKVIYTVLKRTSDISDEERLNLFQIFSRFFEVVSEKDNLNDIFTLSCDGKNKYVELIYEGKKLIGFNLFEISDLKKFTDHKVVHGMISVIDPAYRGYGIMLILAFRLPLVLQKLLDKKVAFFFCSVHYNSYDPIRNLLHYPKYYTNRIRAIAYDAMQTLFDEPAEPLKEGITCFLEEALRVKGAFKLKNNNLFQDCFYEHILGITDKYPDKPRSAPIFTYMTQQTISHVKSVAESLGIDLDCHLQYLAELAVKVFPENFTVQKLVNKLPNNLVFWQGRLEAGASASESKETELNFNPLLRSNM